MIPLRLALLPLLVAAFLALTTRAAPAQEDPVETRLAAFFQALQDGTETPEKTFSTLLTGSPLAEKEEDVKKLVEQYTAFDRTYGPFVANEKLSVKPVGSSVIVTRYLFKAQKFPLAWHFVCYRPNPTGMWVLISLKLDTRIDQLGG